MKVLLGDFHADVDPVSRRGRTPLHLAVEEGHLDVVKCLHEGGADIRRRIEKHDVDYDWEAGFTPLNLAADQGRLDIVKYLLNEGVDVHERDGDKGRTSLHHSVKGNRSEVAKYLVMSAGADVNAKNNNKWAPLHDAAYQTRVKIARFLLHEGALVNERDRDGFTPLLHAACEGGLEVVKDLLKNGADVNVRDIDGQTALHHAARRGQLETLKYLLEAGADADIRDDNEKKAIDVAKDDEIRQALSR